MKEHIKHQVIKSDGKPMFVVVPYEEYKDLIGLSERKVTISHAVVRASVIDGKSRIRAWREYNRLSQTQMAEKMGISQSAYAQMEKPDALPRPATLVKIAAALDLRLDQLN